METNLPPPTPHASDQDLEKYKGFEKLGASRKATYEAIVDQLTKLKEIYEKKPPLGWRGVRHPEVGVGEN